MVVVVVGVAVADVAAGTAESRKGRRKEVITIETEVQVPRVATGLIIIMKLMRKLNFRIHTMATLATTMNTIGTAHPRPESGV